MLGTQQAMDAVAQHGALPNEEAPLSQHFFPIPRLPRWNVYRTHQSRAQQHGEDLCIHFVGLHLRLGDDASLEGVGQRDVTCGHHPFQNLIKPMPVHGGLEHHPRIGPSLHQLREALWRMVVDAPLAQVAASRIHGMKHAVSLVEVDPDEGGGFGDEVVRCGPSLWRRCFFHGIDTLQHRCHR